MKKKSVQKSAPPKITERSIFDYTPDDHNANVGTERGLQMIESSLQRNGVGRSIVADKNGKVPAGNKTLEAAVNAGITKVIEIEDDGDSIIVHKRRDWDLDQIDGPARQYAHEDNRISQVSYNPDADVIAADVAAGVDLSNVYTQPELDYLLNVMPDERYTRKIDIPIYEPSEKKPSISELYDNSVSERLLAAIETAEGITLPEREFLRLAAQRHTVLNFAKIADFYAHSSAEVQRLMEDSALVIIDFNRAIELGYVKLTNQISKIVDDENPEE